MPWKESSTVSERTEFVRLASTEGANLSELCRRFGISRTAAYKWLGRYRSGEQDSLQDRSRAPHSSPARTSAAVEAAIIQLRQQHPAWGGRKLRARLKALGHTELPAASTITAILRRHGLLGAQAGQPRHCQRFEHSTPNALWQIDFKGHFALGSGRCHPLTILDDHSRYAIGLFACENEQKTTVSEHLTAVFRRFGLPDRILCDNGSPWGASGESSYTELGVWLLRLGISIRHGRPYHPQTQGKDERFHRTLSVEVLQGQHFADLTVCQGRFDLWREIYNTQRPHEALGLDVPANRYRPSSRAFPERLPPLEYHATDTVRQVQPDGCISFRNRPWKIGKAFARQPVALRPQTEDGKYQIVFGTIAIAQIDLHEQNA
jgi:transposase InsO family protein